MTGRFTHPSGNSFGANVRAESTNANLDGTVYKGVGRLDFGRTVTGTAALAVDAGVKLVPLPAAEPAEEAVVVAVVALDAFAIEPVDAVTFVDAGGVNASGVDAVAFVDAAGVVVAPERNFGDCAEDVGACPPPNQAATVQPTTIDAVVRLLIRLLRLVRFSMEVID